MKNSHFRSTLQQFLTGSRILPRQPGRPDGKVLLISDLKEFQASGKTLLKEAACPLPPLREYGKRICGRIILQNQIPARPFYSISLRGAHVFGPSVMVVTASGTVICEVSKEWGVYLDTPEASWIQRRFFLPKPRHLAGKTFLLASTGAETFNHWMMESLPRLALWKMAGGLIGKIDHWLVSRKSPSFVRESLNLLGIPWERVLDFGENQHWSCETLELFSLASDWGMPSALSVNFLRASFGVPTASGTGKRFYLVRGETRDRRVIDEPDLVAALGKEGFEPLNSGRLGIRATAAALAGAEWIIAPHGAALTNMVFAPPGCRILEIFNPSFTNPCYRMLAARCHHKYSCYYGAPTRTTANTTAEASGNIVVESSEIKRDISGSDNMVKS